MSIVMTMNIYINAQNTKSLKAEDNMSGLVNHLLKQYYSRPNCKCDRMPIPHSHIETDGESHDIRPATAPTNPFYDEVGFVSEKDLENIKIGKEVTVQSTPSGKKNKSVGFANNPKLKEFATEKGIKFCANGHAIPAGRSKCMGKGCKYA